jgi:molybdopterin/thiamine biosynthesis adenylyltransferase/rhodanese-related sulfurtransferase
MDSLMNEPNQAIVDAEGDFYRRQTALAAVGGEGQRRLKQCRVLIVGVGGLGCPAMRYLAAAGIGRVDVCDPDVVEVSNLHRQVLFDYGDVGRKKAEAAVEKIRRQNPFIEADAYGDCLTNENARDRLQSYDVAVDCTDTLAAKFLIHDACHAARIPLVQAAIYEFEGQLQVFRPGVEAGCMRCIWPEPPPDANPEAPPHGVLGVVPGMLGVLQAAETLKVVLDLPGVCDHETLLIDLLRMQTRRIARKKNPNCPLCGKHAPAAERPPDVADATDDGAIDVAVLTPEALAGYCVIDVRSAAEHLLSPKWVRQCQRIAWTDLDAFRGLDPAKRYLLACAHGVRSRHAAAALRRSGAEHVFFLRQGITSLAPLVAADDHR